MKIIISTEKKLKHPWIVELFRYLGLHFILILQRNLSTHLLHLHLHLFIYLLFLSLSIPIFDTEVAEPIEVQKKQGIELQSLSKKKF
jgi:hypothetical protein